MTEFNIYELMQRMAHRYPFLLIDKVLACEPEKYVTAQKNVTANEPCFAGHFPEYPVFPGVLVIEAMAQTTAVLTFESLQGYDHNNAIFMLVGVDKARFKKQVIPGDVMKIHVELGRRMRNIWRFDVTATVDDAVVCTAEIVGAMTDR